MRWFPSTLCFQTSTRRLWWPEVLICRVQVELNTEVSGRKKFWKIRRVFSKISFYQVPRFNALTSLFERQHLSACLCVVVIRFEGYICVEISIPIHNQILWRSRDSPGSELWLGSFAATLMASFRLWVVTKNLGFLVARSYDGDFWAVRRKDFQVFFCDYTLHLTIGPFTIELCFD